MAERGWDRFLTPRDLEVMRVSGRAKARPYGLGSHPALLLIDIYLAALGPERLPIVDAVARWPMACGDGGWRAVDRAAELLAAAREAEVPVVHVTLLEFPTPWARGHVADTAERVTEESPGSFDIVAEVAPLDHEVVIRKTAPSAFQGTPLTFYLNALGIDTVIVCGESTSGCVRASVVDAVTHRLKVGVVEDACFDRTEASHWMNLFDMDQKYGDVMTTSDAVEYFDELRRRDG